MSNIVMYDCHNDTHSLSLSLGPMEDISVRTSIAACDTTPDNINHRGAQYIPRNIVSIVVRDMTLKMVHPLIT